MQDSTVELSDTMITVVSAISGRNAVELVKMYHVATQPTVDGSVKMILFAGDSDIGQPIKTLPGGMYQCKCLS